MLQRIANGLSRAARAPVNAVSLLRCMRDMRNLDGNSSIKDLANFCNNYAIRPQQVSEELVRLYEIVSEVPPKAALEIGTYTGGNAVHDMSSRRPGRDGH